MLAAMAGGRDPPLRRPERPAHEKGNPPAPPRYPAGVPVPDAPDGDLDAIQAAGSDPGKALADALERHRARLLRMVDLRMHPALRGRIGASDVLQDAWLEISNRLGDYLADPRMPFFLWIRFITAQRLMALHRLHLGAQKRDVRRQVSLGHGTFPSATSVALVDRLVATGTTPTQAAVHRELRLQLEEALDRMNETDREVLVLRHFEELTNTEAAGELGIETSAASKRYVRALHRLRDVLESCGIPPGDSAL